MMVRLGFVDSWSLRLSKVCVRALGWMDCAGRLRFRAHQQQRRIAARLYNLEMCTASVQLKGAHEARLAARLRSSWAAVGSWMDSTLSSVRMESIHKGPSNHKKEAVQAPAPASAAGQASATAAKVISPDQTQLGTLEKLHADTNMRSSCRGCGA